MKIRFLLSLLLALVMITTNAQKSKNTTSPSSKEEGYKFTPVVELKATPVKNQASTGTCWCLQLPLLLNLNSLEKAKVNMIFPKCGL